CAFSMYGARVELTQHALAGTRRSTLRVCQFRHEPEFFCRAYPTARSRGKAGCEYASLPAGWRWFKLRGPAAARYWPARRLSRMAVMHEGRVLSDLMAVDIGNSRVKIGHFQRECSGETDASKGIRTDDGPLLPEPVATFDLPIRHDTGE